MKLLTKPEKMNENLDMLSYNRIRYLLFYFFTVGYNFYI